MKTNIEPFYVELGRRIQQIRAELGMTQEALGQLLHPPVTRASIANLEIGKQRVLAHTLVQIAKALEVSLQDLVSDIGSEQTGDWNNKAMEEELEAELKVSSRQIRKLVSQIKSSGKRRKQ